MLYICFLDYFFFFFFTCKTGILFTLIMLQGQCGTLLIS
jgi:hypothetical protein